MRKKITFISIAIILVIVYVKVNGQVKYPYPFNPEKGIVDASEQPFRHELCLNGTWQFMPVFSHDTNDLKLPDHFDWSPVSIRIPSPWNVNSFAGGNGSNFVTFPTYPEKWNDANIAWMKKSFTVPASWKGKQLFLYFQAVAGNAVYYLNGRKIGENFDIFFPYQMNISKWIKPGGKNELVVGVASPKLYNQPGKYGRRTYVAGSFWGTSMRGIWQDVYLLAKPSVYISNVYVQPDVNAHQLKVEVTVKNDGTSSQKFNISGTVGKWENLADTSLNQAPVQMSKLGATVLHLQNNSKVALASGDSLQLTITKRINGELSYWTPDTPNLYGLVLSLDKGRKTLDKKYTRFGWRQFSISGSHLLLNGKVIHLKGDSWHFMGVPEMTRRYAWAWFKMLKDANANAVRLHAQPYPSFFLDVADEMGICVLDESGIWASDGGPKMNSDEFWNSCKVHLRHLVLRDRNHPAIFGWSVCNETIPVAVNVFHAPDSIVQHLLHEINDWVALVKKLDPSRQWVSGDGETQFENETDFPVTVGHYGGEEGMQHWSSEGKPWGIGEQGMAYYGTPKQVSEFNGNRAYVSQEGRMEGLAIQAYHLLNEQHKLDASYASIFNIVWYGLKPLPLGMKNIHDTTSLQDGVFFTDFKEGMPGMQPERLGPYTTTLNPGYDPSLPLYQVWPLFYAVQAANANPVQPFSISKDSSAVPVALEGFKPEKKIVRFYASGQSALWNRLQDLGLDTSGNIKEAGNIIAIVDGKNPPESVASLKQLTQIANAGGSVFVIGVAAHSLPQLNAILPAQLTLSDRAATSFIKEKNVPLLSGLGNANFYFTELFRHPVMIHGLSGAFVEKGQTDLAACNTDWSKWNYRPEYAKTAAVLESEREEKASGSAIVSYASGSGRYMVSSLELDSLGTNADALLVQMLSNLGASFQKGQMNNSTVIDADGFVESALVAGIFSKAGLNRQQLIAHDFLNNESAIQPAAGTLTAGRYWQRQQVGDMHQFDFDKMPLTGGRSGGVVYLSFWLYSPRSLVNLLAEPDMPSLQLNMQAAGGAHVLLNGRQLNQSSETGQITIRNLPLNKGWNHFLIKVLEERHASRFKVQFQSDPPEFIKQLKSNLSQ